MQARRDPHVAHATVCEQLDQHRRDVAHAILDRLVHNAYRLELKGESATWMLWLDDNFKLLKIAIPSEETEVVRD